MMNGMVEVKNKEKIEKDKEDRVLKICPMMSRAQGCSNSWVSESDGVEIEVPRSNIECLRENCAWWCRDRCAMTALAESRLVA